FDYKPVFDQYLTDVKIPELQVYLSDDKKSFAYRYSNCNKNFNLPLVLKNDRSKLALKPTTDWQKISLTDEQFPLIDKASVEKMYYLNQVTVTQNPL
ncbi:MAG: hypothetical protein ABW174_12815, partial [Flavitalea sp.]